MPCFGCGFSIGAAAANQSRQRKAEALNKEVGPCQYTKEQIEALIAKAKGSEVNRLKSALNLYSTNCNYYSKHIDVINKKYS